MLRLKPDPTYWVPLEVSANLYCNSCTSVLGRLRDYLRLLIGRTLYKDAKFILYILIDLFENCVISLCSCNYNLLSRMYLSLSSHKNMAHREKVSNIKQQNCFNL